ncbi:hypothetical protein VTJ83DRAFT_2782 [Remersonia thermophila]|uniref:Minor extracellular protease vpr n=1 Tax=Remersonia thermophila TaxID=72144 RepID=A0ABR4DJP8_9PEZI
MLWYGAALALLAGRAIANSVTDGVTDPPAIVPGAYIVEYEVDQDTDALIDKLGGEASLRRDLRFKLFKGASIQVNNLEHAESVAAKVAEMPKVKRVFPVRKYAVPHHTVHSTGSAVEAIVSKRAAGGNDTFSTHLMTQVNKFRDNGITGKGIKIAVIDTGIDYLHPAMGGCFGPGCLVSYGADLVGDNFDGSNTPRPDGDPMDCQGHGTHVAGTIAAQDNNPYGIIGAAQGVELGAYRVFGCEGDTPNDVLIAAYNMAYEAGSDIITASIGGPSGWAEDPWAAVVTRIVENGVPCVVSAGNDGSAGIFYASTAANGRKVTAIASIDNWMTPTLLANASFSVDNKPGSDFGFTAGDPSAWGEVTKPLWIVSHDTTDPAHGCDPYPEDTPDLSGYIVLIRRGTCTFVQKATNAAAKGAKHIVFYNNQPGTVIVSATGVEGVTAVAMVTADQGEAWVRELEAGRQVVVTMTDPSRAGKFLIYAENTVSGGFLSDFTSWGPTYEVEVKPQIATPGGLILSTYPRALGSYGVLSGTSMACPLAAGVYALIMNVRGTKDPKTIENLLSATSKPNLFRFSGQSAPFLAPVPQQGAGLIQAWDAAHSTTLLSVSSLSFNDTEHFAPVQNFTVHNTGKTEVTYSLGHHGAATAYTFLDPSFTTPVPFPGILTQEYASLTFATGDRFTLPPGHRKIVSVRVQPPALDAKLLPVYSGYVTINGTDGSNLSLPYLGVVGNMRSAKVLDPARTYVRSSKTGAELPVPPNTTFVLPPAGFSNDTSYRNRTEMPRLNVQLTMGSAQIRAYVVPVGNTADGIARVSNPFGLNTIGLAEGFPAMWNPRGPSAFIWDGKLEHGEFAPAGKYRLVVKALRIFGNPENKEDYDEAQSVEFNIRYLSGGSAKLRRWKERCRDEVTAAEGVQKRSAIRIPTEDR